MNLRSIDLNLLVIFDAIVAERSVTRAAQRIGVSQPAISHALGRLRDLFQDELIRRTAEGMVPTRRGAELANSLAEGLHQIRRALTQQLDFDPRTSERTFKISVSDYLVGCILPRICVRARNEAPGVTLSVTDLPPSSGMREPGEIELRVNVTGLAPELERKQLLHDRYVLVMSSIHPAARGSMTHERLVGLSFVRIAEPSIGSRLVDDVLEREDLTRRVVLTVPSLVGVLTIVENSDLCAILPEQLITAYGSPNTLFNTSLPLTEIAYTVDIVWQSRDSADPGHRWLRGLIEDEFDSLYSGSGGNKPICGVPAGSPPPDLKRPATV